MWTRPQIKDFKEKIRQDADSVITVGRGEVVTVRVPTHEEGSYLFWEFATDYYDIGFGVFFEWTDAASASVSVHVSESSDEDEDEEGEAWKENSVNKRMHVLWWFLSYKYFPGVAALLVQPVVGKKAVCADIVRPPK